MHHKSCTKCNCKFPWGISSQDGVCFPCRWPAYWTEKNQAEYENRVKAWKSPNLLATA